MSKPTIVIKDRVYVPVKFVDMKQIKAKYDKTIYDNNSCRRCEHKQDRHSYLCDTCQSFKGRYITYGETVKNNQKYVSLPRAELYKLEELGIKSYKLVDKTSRGTPLNPELKITRNLYDYQQQCVEDIVTGDGRVNYIPHGILKAAPRSGKTLTSLAIAIRLGEKFLILANQEDLLIQFMTELKDSTNIEDIDKFNGKKSYGLCRSVKDYQTYDICLSTYQTFISAKGKKRLKEVRNLFSTIIIDEAHRASANKFSEVVDKFTARHKIGLTATDKRKDGMDFITSQILGEVMTEAKSVSLKPKVYVHKTNVRPAYAYKTWNAAMQFLAKSKSRIELILQYIKKDIKNGHKIVIPVTYRAQATELVAKIREMGYTAEAFTAGVNREKLLADAKAGKIDVVVGIRSILATGVNVPRWSSIMTIAPISNPPNYYQETMRVCTPMEGKRQPIIRIFVDEMAMTRGCFRTCWFKTIIPHGYIITDSAKSAADEILSNMRQRYDDDSDSGELKVYKDPNKSKSSYTTNKGKPAWKPVALFKKP